MLDTRMIVQKFLDTKMQVHPDVVRYLSERSDLGLIDRIIENLPGDTVVVSVKNIPGVIPDRDGNRFATESRCEILKGSAGSSGNSGCIQDYLHY
ncbi:MAG: DNA polymerase II small subunit, partial [Methanoregulaceae archaeon]|nr:DNA polymerase II small subunit [Methanoregulaceae archaeon]